MSGSGLSTMSRISACASSTSRSASREFNFSFGESLRFVFQTWVDRKAIRRFLQEPVHTNISFDAIYARS
jgi:hypothetical protein